MSRTIENQERDIYLKKLQTGEILGPPVGKPSIDKPWLKYYEDKYIMQNVPQKTLYECLIEEKEEKSNKEAINYFDNIITYKELFEKIDEVSKALLCHNVKKGDMVSIISPTTLEVVYLLYGISKIGAVSNLIDPRASKKEISDFINESKSNLLFVVESGEYIDKINEGAKDTCAKEIFTIDMTKDVDLSKKLQLAKLMLFDKESNNTFAERLKNMKFERPNNMRPWQEFYDSGKDYKYDEKDFPSYEPNTPAILIHTGGTTGKPKGVLLSNENINATAYQIIRSEYDLQKNQRWLNIMPAFIAYGVGNSLHLPFVVGMEVIIIPQFKPNQLASLFKKYHFNHMTGVPEHFDKLIESKKVRKEDFSNIKSLVMGGDKASETREIKKNQWLKQHNSPYKISKGYGMTEVAAATCATSVDRVNKIGSIGNPFVYTDFGIFKLSDDENHIYNENDELRYNQLGEICMSGPNTMIGYLDNEAEEKKVIKIHEDGKKWVHSGDIGYIDEDGCLFFEDRVKNIMALNSGFKVYPDKIEKVLMKNPKVDKCKVIGIKDTESYQGMKPLAFVVPNSENILLTDELKELCEKELPDYSQPVDFIIKDKLPLTKVGKVNQIELLNDYVKLLKENKSRKRIKK